MSITRTEIKQAFTSHTTIDRLGLNRLLPWPYRVQRSGQHLILVNKERNRTERVLGENASTTRNGYRLACANDLIDYLEKRKILEAL